MKKGFFYKHPIIGGLIAMAIVALICNAAGGISGVFAAVAEAVKAGAITADSGDLTAKLELARPFLSNDFPATVGNAMVAISSIICLLIFCALNRKNSYRGPFKIRGQKLTDVKIYAIIFVVIDIIGTLVYLFTYPGGFPKISISVSMIVLALYAGFNEEIIDRAIPAALMMRNKPSSRRVTAVVLITTLLFGVSHFVNLFSGRELVATIIQIIFSAGAGLFFIGIYLRTGSITVTIAIHALHDLMVFITKTLPEAEASPLINDIFTLVVNFLPFVFGILMLLPKHHAAIVDTWKQIWPEKDAPADDAASE